MRRSKHTHIYVHAHLWCTQWIADCIVSLLGTLLKQSAVQNKISQVTSSFGKFAKICTMVKNLNTILSTLPAMYLGNGGLG